MHAAILRVGLIAGLGLAGVTAGQPQFVDVSGTHGIQPYLMANGKGGGVAAADFDDDGDVDLFVPTEAGTPDQLYRNLGDGSFEEIGAAAGVASMQRGRSALWLDYDADGRLDLFVAGDCWDLLDPTCANTSTLRLYRQTGDALFVDVSVDALPDDLIGPDDEIDTHAPHRGGISAGDVNQDGLLDLVFGFWAEECRLLLNNGAGGFDDQSVSSGIGGLFGHYWQPVMHDFDGDGWTDVYCAVDFDANRMWINQRDGTFGDMAEDSGTDSAWNDMGVALGDVDNDGDFDVYVTNITSSTRHNRLYRNDSDGEGLAFVDVAEASGTASGGWGWGATFLDADNDGDLDLAATNGWFGGTAGTDPSVFFLNGGGHPLAFAEVSDEVGFNDTLWGSSVIALDADRDGDLDLVQTCNASGIAPGMLRLLDNQPGPESAGFHHLVVRPRSARANNRAIGAVVRVTTKGTTQSRIITAGTSHCGQEPAEAFFGLADATAADEVAIEWPGGGRTVIEDVPADGMLTPRQLAAGGVAGAGGALVFTDITPIAGIGLPGTLTESVAWGDYDNDGDEDLYLTSDGTNRLFRNDGGGVFTDVTSVAGVGNGGFSVGTGFGDLDNDGDLDLYVVNFGTGPDVLYRNNGPIGPDDAYTFSDITALAGTTVERSSRGMAFVDVDRDGLLDIYVNAIGMDLLYHNMGSLQFEDIAGLLVTENPPAGQGVGVVATDLDGNGWIDLYNGNRSGEISNVFMNSGGSLFDIATAAGVTASGLGMGVLSFDYDNDLDMDLYWTTWPGNGKEPVVNALYENQGDGTSYVDVAGSTGTADPLGWGISCNAADIDNDRWMDFIVTNGFSETSGPNVLFRNVDGESFEDVTSVLSISDYDGRGAAFADFDGDGDLDLVLTGDTDDETRLWRNDSTTGNGWIAFRLTGTTSNRSAIGAWIEVTADGVTTVQEVSGGAGRGSFNSLPVEFGLGAATAVETVLVRWPSGREQVLTDLAAGAYHAIVEPLPADVNADGVVNVDDLVLVILSWGACPTPPPACAADVNGDLVVDVDDLVEVILNWTV